MTNALNVCTLILVKGVSSPAVFYQQSIKLIPLSANHVTQNASLIVLMG